MKQLPNYYFDLYIIIDYNVKIFENYKVIYENQ